MNLAIKPTESELEILQILWEKGTATVREAHVEICKIRNVGYTTTLKIMQIMYEKGLVERDNSMKTHVFRAAIVKQHAQKHLLGKMVSNLFGGSHTQLIIHALGDAESNAAELASIEAYISELKANAKVNEKENK